MRDSVLDDKKYILGQFIKNGTAGSFVVNDNGDRKCQDPMKAGAAVGEFVKKVQ